MRRMVIACLLVGACARGPSARAPENAVSDGTAAPASVASCARRTQGPRPARVSTDRQGSAVALARLGDRLLAYVADGDSRSVHTIAVDEGRELARTRVDGEPRELLVLGDGRVAATLSDGTRVAVLEPAEDPAAPLAALCTREVAAEPWGLALSRDESTLVVTSGWGSALTVLDAGTFAVRRVVALPRDPRAVLVDDAGVAYVSHLVGAKLSVVDLEHEGATEQVDLRVRKSTPFAREADRRVLRTGVQSYALAKVALPAVAGKAAAERLLVPMVSVDPGDAERARSAYYGPPFDGVPKEAPLVGVVDPATRQALSRVLLGTGATQPRRECLLPRAAAVREKTASLLVACFGIDQVLELDALAVDPLRAIRRRFAVPPGPTGVAVDEASGRAVVFSQMGAEVTVLRLDEPDPARARAAVRVDYHPDPALADAAQGRLLFYRTDDERIAGDGLGCASCHVDGREDGVTWTTPMGPRQTPMLAGRLRGTEPYGWEGDRATLADYVHDTVTRLGGNGLQSDAIEQLAKYLLVLRPPPGRAPTPAEAELVGRGRDLFESDEQGCASCHAGDLSTDTTKHDLWEGAFIPPGPIDTPSLRSVAGTAPYFHDGRYGTLDALLSDPASRMGHSASLPPRDRVALAAYLRTL